MCKPVDLLTNVYYTQKWIFCHHLLTLKLLQTCMSFFLLLSTKEDIQKNDWNFGTIDFHWIPCVQQKKETHKGLQQTW